ncbi:endoglucanase-6B [Colletotrichum somersetense]|nr:endoglucanase-6B [Colletotrichum somersetense]
MHFASVVAVLSALGAVSASPRPGIQDQRLRRAATSPNPFEGRKLYANPIWAQKLEETHKAFLSKGDTQNASKVRTAQSTGSFVWVSSTSMLSDIDTAITGARAAQSKTGQKQTVGLVLYNLPDRDCSAGESAGEFSTDKNGLQLYKDTFVKPFAQKLAKATDLNFAVVVEPDALANLVTNSNVALCAKAKTAYQDGIANVIASLQYDHVGLYIDAANGGWLGWDKNLESAAEVFAKVVKQAGNNAKIRGFSTNVSNYNPFNANPRESFTEGSNSYDENHYALSLAPHLEAQGLPSRFIIDQSRVSNNRKSWGDWCNVSPAGFGMVPGTPVNNNHIDSIVWVKTAGESDGKCGLSGAPAAGAWFDTYVQMLVKNADASLVASKA